MTRDSVKLLAGGLAMLAAAAPMFATEYRPLWTMGGILIVCGAWWLVGAYCAFRLERMP